jgi:hypothetical protein
MVVAVVLCTALAIIVFVAVFWFTSGVKVVIVNRMTSEIRNLQIDFAGGVVAAPAIGAGSEYWTVVRPSSASHLELRFTDPSGKQRNERIGVYFERGYTGEILIEVEPEGTLKFEDKTRLPNW